ncbi:MAG: restriction endonuclease, partial [Oscillibacter sp.]|nr:restriction endonuclease [Oscillibacter sp.]
MWYLNRVDSVKALAKLLKEDRPDNPFREYEVIIAAGDGRESDNDDAANAKAFDRVKAAIAKHDKTITLTVGQLTVGVTIPEWSGVLMLCNMQSPSSYMQAAFRSQNPCTLTSDGQRFRKENAYLFDFDPARTLIIFDEFANNLSSETAGGRGTGEDRERNIRRLLNFFPVIGEDDEGKMVELDAKAVLSIPRKLKSQEVVRHGFMSNFLFQNISNIFGAPSAVQEIIQKLTPAQEDPKKNKRDSVEKIGEVSVDDNGEADVSKEIVIGRTQELFGPKVYETMRRDVTKAVEAVSGGTEEETKRQIRGVMDAVKRTVQENVVAPAVNNYDVKKSVKAKMERDTEREIEKKLTVIQDDYMQQSAVAKAELERAQAVAVTHEEVKAAQSAYQETMRDAMRALATAVETEVKRTIEEKPAELLEQLERHEAEEKKRGVEEGVRAHLRGFARTIPSFLMAYGNDGVTLANFDRHIEKEVFWEVTGITLDDFRFLRDGGDYTDSETGEVRHFAGHLFDEVVFND